MIKRSAAHIIPLLVSVVFVFGFAITINAQTVTSNSCSLADVQTAINNAARGVTVTVPAGNCNWGTGALTVSKGITLQGTGIGITTITVSGTGDSVYAMAVSPDATAIANEETIKIAGFTFDGGGTSHNLMKVFGAGDTGTKPFKNLIITGNKFQNLGSLQGNGNTAIRLFGQVRGVIYSNIFDDVDIVVRPMGNNTTTEWENPTYNNFSYGSGDNLYFEDNTIQYSSPYTSSDGNVGWIETGQGGRIVVRSNTWNMNNSGGGPSFSMEWWDIHGFQNFPSNGQTGSMMIEYYNNAITTPFHGYRWFNHRGSWGMFFNNTYSGPDTPVANVDQYNGGCTNQIVPAPISYNPLVNNTYAFYNLANGTDVPMTAGSSNACGVIENNNWWNYNASFNGTAGIGRGLLSARPASCSTGVGYWATDQGSWNTKLAPNTSGQFYKCTSTNAWTLYYKPLTYPHPLRSGSPSAGAPGAPTNLQALVH